MDLQAAGFPRERGRFCFSGVTYLTRPSTRLHSVRARNQNPPVLGTITQRYMQLPIELLTEMTGSLRRPAQPRPFPMRLWSDIQQQGWAYLSQVEDLVLAMDDRLYNLRLADLADAASYPPRPMRNRPRFKNADCYSMPMMEAADVAGFCIFLEELGFAVDPAPMAESLYEQVSAKPFLTQGQGDVYCYRAMRHKHKRMLQARESVDTAPVQLEWRSVAGHRYQCLERDGQVTLLTIRGPRWRQPLRVEVACAGCGITYTRGDPEAARNHRTAHAQALRLLEPQPSARMREKLRLGIEGERVDVNAPLWMHREVAARAVRFKRDFGYDFVQWPSISTRARLDSRWVGYLFADAAGAIDGACAFHHDQGQWSLHWAWVRPERRRHGLLAARWPHFLDRFGDFWIEHPLSDAMLEFITQHATPMQRQMIRELYPDGSPIENPKN